MGGESECLEYEITLPKGTYVLRVDSNSWKINIV